MNALLLLLLMAGLQLLAPRDDGLVLGDTVRVEVSGVKSAPSCRVDGVAVAPVWSALPYGGHFVADVRLHGPGRHEVEVASGGSTARARFEVATSAVVPGDLVARHFLAARPADELGWQWGPAVFLYGLERFSRVSADRPRLVAAVERYHAHHAARGLPAIDYPDVCAPALSALALARDEGIATGLGSARRVADYLRKEPRNALGAIDHLGANGHLRKWVSLVPGLQHWAHSIWVDSLVMYALFSAQWGASSGDAALRDFGAAQPGIFGDELQDPVTGLFTHAWDVKHARPLGTRWLRGNGWVGLAIVEILDELPANHPRRPELERRLGRLADGLVARQLESGLWDSVVDLPGASYEESSGSALAAYALAKGARRGWLPASMRARARATFEALTARLRRRPDGLSVTGTSTATNPTPRWIYELIPRRDDVDYGVGAYLLLATELSTESWVAP